MTRLLAQKMLAKRVEELGSQQAVADEIGCSKAAICLYLGGRRPHASIMERMAKAKRIAIPVAAWFTSAAKKTA